MTGRLPSGITVTALLRRVNDGGGLGAVLARGDPQAGALLVVAVERGGAARLFERGIGPDGCAAIIDSTPTGDLETYWRRRCARDPDLWVIELNGSDLKRLVAESMLPN